MSIIMAVGNKHKLILASDGRVSDTDDNGNQIILDEKFKKIIRLSSSVCVLIAGNRSQCMQIVRILQSNVASSTAPKLCAEAVTYIIQNPLFHKEKEVNVKMIVAGINLMKERELYLFSADQNGIIEEKMHLQNNIIYIAKGDIEEGEDDYFYPILSVESRDIRTNIELCIAEAARRNKSVNNVVFFEEL